MSEFKRQHPVAAITRAVELVRGNLVTIIILMVFGAGGGGSSFFWIFIGLFVFVLLAGTTGWWRFHYRVQEGELQIRHGLLVRKQLYLTRDRIQVIDISSGIIQRQFGLVRVEIKTAGSTSREAFISAIRRDEAEELVRQLKRNHSGDRLEEAPEQTDREYPLPVRELLIAASTSGSFGIALSLIATVFSQVEPLLDESELYDWFINALPGEADMLFILSLLLVFILFAWLVSFFGTLFRFGGFRLLLQEDEMVIRQGVFEKKRITIPFRRIQAVRIVEGVLRQPMGYAAIYVESAGYGEQKEAGSVPLMPLIRRDRVATFLQEILPDYQCEWTPQPPPRRALIRYIIRSSVVLALLLVGIQWLLAAPAMIWTLMFFGIFWGWLRYRDAAVGTDGDRMVLRSRMLARTTAIVQKKRVQDITSKASWIQQKRDLANLIVSVASGDQGRSFQVSDLEQVQSAGYLPWIRKRDVTSSSIIKVPEDPLSL